jgi:predicted ATPase/DNA-binding CsgD family transcriptional regulator
MGNNRGIPAALTSFVGRDTLLDDALCVLRKSRLLTLTGPAGVGKTRLALEVTRRAQPGYDETAVARLAELTGSGDVERSLIGALGIVDQSSEPPLRVLVEYLRDRRALLVLDNCEHLWDAVGDMVTVLLEEAPQISVIATSRRYLEVAGEYVLPVPPLAVPEMAQADAAVTDAVVLLLDRAGAAGQALRDREAGWDELIELVRWSGGLPLALELIAFRLADGMSPGVILDRLDGGRILTAQRSRRHHQTHHRTLYQVLDWSATLCSEDERRLWARLSVFSGGFDLAMAEEVCVVAGGPVTAENVMELLTGLVRQSIVIVDGNGRLQQLQPIREHGQRLLVQFGEEERMRERHCAFVCRLVAGAAEQWFGPDELDWLGRIELDMPDVRAALTYCVEQERAETGLRIVTDIARLRLPFFVAMLGELCSWFETFLAFAPPSELRVEATAMLGWIRICQGARKRAQRLLDECVASSADHPAVLFLRGAHLLLVHGDRASIELLRLSRDAFHEAGACGDAHLAELIYALAAGFLGTEDEARQAADECRANADAHGAPWAIGWAMWSQGLAARTPQDALTLFKRSLAMQVEMRDHWGAVWSAEAIAWTWAALGLAHPAAELLGGVIAVQQRTGVQIAGLTPFERERDHAAARAKAAIGADSYESAFAAGTALSTEQVYALALQPAPAKPDRPATLTRRQWEIARLVARGMTNKDIADTLIIAQRTVENHLGQVFTRLGARNRAQVAAWVSEQETPRDR